MIQITNLSKKYKGTTIPAVNNISFDVSRGEIFGLLGTNGAGKTTTFSMLCGMLKPDLGEILIDKKNVRHDLNEIKKIVGVVPQDIALYPSLTAVENLMFFGKMYGLGGKDLKTKIKENLSIYGLAEHADKKIINYSGGMKRRINLIAGILHNPKVLFLDEPAVGIDAHSRREIMQQLFALNQNNGTTVIYTSHYLEEAEKFCSQIAILSSGKIITQGKPEDLMKKFQCSGLEEVFFKVTDVEKENFTV
jgi:ABC-2 type transport system ATP-binding protein